MAGRRSIAEHLLQLLAFPLEPGRLLLAEGGHGAVGRHAIQVLEPGDAGLDRLEVGQGTPQPALGDEVLPRPLRLLHDDLLGLLLRAHEEHGSARRHRPRHRIPRDVQALHRLLEIEDVDPVPLDEDVLLHLGIPPPGLVSEVDPGLE